jgi:hypothetical protein
MTLLHTSSFDKCFGVTQHRSKHREPVERLRTNTERSQTKRAKRVKL